MYAHTNTRTYTHGRTHTHTHTHARTHARTHTDTHTHKHTHTHAHTHTHTPSHRLPEAAPECDGPHRRTHHRKRCCHSIPVGPRKVRSMRARLLACQRCTHACTHARLKARRLVLLLPHIAELISYHARCTCACIK